MNTIITRRGRSCDAINLRGMTDKDSTLLIRDDNIFEVIDNEYDPKNPVATLVVPKFGHIKYTELAKEANRSVMMETRYFSGGSPKKYLTMYFSNGDVRSMEAR